MQNYLPKGLIDDHVQVLQLLQSLKVDVVCVPQLGGNLFSQPILNSLMFGQVVDNHGHA